MRLLEIGVDPQVADRLQGHHLLAGLHVVARIDVAAADDAVDFREDAAIAEIELGLVEVPLGLEDLGLGLFHGGRLADDLFIDAIDVPLRIAMHELFDHLLRRQVVGRGLDAQLGGCLHQLRLRLADAGKGLVEVRGHVGQVLAFGRNGRQPERHPRLVDAFQGLLDLGLGDPQCRTRLIVLLLRDGMRGDETWRPGRRSLAPAPAWPSAIRASPRWPAAGRPGYRPVRWRVAD